MMEYTLGRAEWNVRFSAADGGITVSGGHFGALSLLPSTLFTLRLQDACGTQYTLNSDTGWSEVLTEETDGVLHLRLAGPDGHGDIAVLVNICADDAGLSFDAQVINSTANRSVTELTYPTPAVTGQPLHLFIPDCCGRAINGAGENGFWGKWNYPGHNMSMQYFAFWGAEDGVYIGFHDPDACMKTFTVTAGEHRGQLEAAFPGIGIGDMGNSFALGGCVRWQYLPGDWYDAAMIYAAFVRTEAKWLPERGRPDTGRRFKEIPFWICDYIPNSPAQMEARPMTLATVSERYGKDYWVDAAIALKARLGTPIGYHVYNWHEIPFNINYPHFLPARDVFRAGLQRLKDAGVSVFPYINAVSWEMHDADEGFEENFGNIGHLGAAIMPDGNPVCDIYPQVKADGSKTHLVPMCPMFHRWRQIICDVARGMEADLPIDGIYFDQIAAVPSYPCRSRDHGHLPGGGSYWSDGYCEMMEQINRGKPADAFYFTESNAEPYMRVFDGYLTWVWTMGDDVPAFPAVYAGYIQMLGRYTDGAKRDDDVYFRYHLAEGLLFGQQLGWLNAHVVYNDARMAYLERLVHTRMAYSALFTDGCLLRPPVVHTDIAPVTSSGITMRQVVAGMWKTAGGDRAVLFVVNVSDRPAHACLSMRPAEYGIACGDTLEFSLEPMSVTVREFPIG